MIKNIKTIFILCVLCALCGSAHAGRTGVSTIFDAQAITASGTATSTAQSLENADGLFGYFLQVTGTSSAIKLELYGGMTKTGTFYPVGALTADNIIVTAFGPTSGRDSNGIQVWYFEINTPLFPFYKFKATELNGAATVVTFKLAVK
jgi:hypothetical protein